jgi:hypothetical protein
MESCSKFGSCNYYNLEAGRQVVTEHNRTLDTDAICTNTMASRAVRAVTTLAISKSCSNWHQ